MVLAISAPPPVPNMKPTLPMTIRKGMTRFTAAKGRFAGIIGYEIAVHHAVDGSKHHHDDGRQGKTQQAFPGKVIG